MKKQIETNGLPVKATKEFLKYPFTNDEIHEKGLELARLNSEVASIESEKKSVVSQFKAKIDEKNASIEVLSTHINNGYEHRYIDCKLIYNDPNTGMKSIYRNDNGELVRKESMTSDELQLDLQFETQAEEKE